MKTCPTDCPVLSRIEALEREVAELRKERKRRTPRMNHHTLSPADTRARLGVSDSTLREWEADPHCPLKAERTRGNHRRYLIESIERLEQLKRVRTPGEKLTEREANREWLRRFKANYRAREAR